MAAERQSSSCSIVASSPSRSLVSLSRCHEKALARGSRMTWMMCRSMPGRRSSSLPYGGTLEESMMTDGCTTSAIAR